MNSYQAIVITNGRQTFAVFTYNCGLLQWTGFGVHAVVGFNAFGELFENHVLSGSLDIGDIACVNEPCSEWSNQVYQISLPGDIASELRAQCFEQAFADRSLPEIFALPCPCSSFQAFFDRRFFWAGFFGYPRCYMQWFPIFGTSIQLCC